MVALSGAHSIGQAHCFSFHDRIFNNESDIDSGFASTRRRGCHTKDGGANLAPLDLVTPNSFDNNYFRNLVQKKGLLESTDNIVREYSDNNLKFKSDFAVAMVKMSVIRPLIGDEGVIRSVCGVFDP
ncbi:putative peroxidase [Helianthus anomalus]